VSKHTRLYRYARCEDQASRLGISFYTAIELVELGYFHEHPTRKVLDTPLIALRSGITRRQARGLAVLAEQGPKPGQHRAAMGFVRMFFGTTVKKR
jgi:hypothetical protein